ncbi:TetR/AcrR family transcriptional regulator [Loktanella sp. S4079]|uniref:TetR/AcrR family transcriptional regulator n=1 Tax=Loktanella sp. S4079 TaxID=579483 RepID=UPI0005F9F586|nr:TetR/AcrR family transcriptional regulator [Loktanella sp. S4079]KJZ18049.1 TetR family transcriptional regulator [Loktanella sp. S4079]
MPDGAIEPKKGRKFDQVLDGARKVFLSDGFEGASVDDIAKVAGVSKATLYSYFPDKRFLFLQVAKSECCKQADRAIETIDMDAPVDKVLFQAAREIGEFITSDFGMRIFRVCVGESGRFPELGREFYQSGPLLVRDRLVEYFKKAIAKNELKIDDLELAADQFNELCRADLFPRMLFSIADRFTAEEKHRIAKGAVDVFMARYGTTA